MGVCSARWLAVGVCLAWLTACGKSSSSGADEGGERGGSAGETGTGGSSAGVGNEGGAGATSGTGGGGGDEDCTQADAVVPTRVVRLSFAQIQAALAVLIGESGASTVLTGLDLPSSAGRGFLPLSATSEGAVIDETVWARGDALGQAVGKYVLDNFATVTDCGATPSDECGQSFVETLAERAARRPLMSVERENFLTVYSESKAAGGTVQEAVQYGVYAVIDSPLFLYRFELGEPGAGADEEVELPPYELASFLSFFLTDAPPDAELLAAAADGSIGEPSVLEAQALRLIETPVAHAHLTTAFLSHFGYTNLETLVVDSTDFTNELRAAMRREGERFFDDVLFGGGPLARLLNSPSSTINLPLAVFYGIDGFPNGALVDAEGFARVELPESRAGLFTMPGFLATKSHPEGFRTMDRGVAVSALALCDVHSVADHPAVGELPDVSERERAELRAADPACADCHTRFDPLGVALEAFDFIGRERSEDAQGRPIDPSTTLHEEYGGARVANAVEMAAELSRSDTFAACVAKNLVLLSLADIADGVPETRRACAIRDIERAFADSGDESFSSLIERIVRSPFLRTRVVRP